VQRARPGRRARQRDLRRPDDRERQGQPELRPRQPGDERRDEDEDLEGVHREAGVAVRVQRAGPGAEEVGADEVDLDEDPHHDEGRQAQVDPARHAAHTGHGATLQTAGGRGIGAGTDRRSVPARLSARCPR
jgi:hypothetical protein